MKINEILNEGPAYDTGYATGAAAKKGAAVAGQAVGLAAKGAVTGAGAAAKGVFRGLKQAAPSGEFYNYAGGEGPRSRVYQVQVKDPMTGQPALYTKSPQHGWVGADNIVIMDPNMIKTLDQALAAQMGVSRPTQQVSAPQPTSQQTSASQQQPTSATK